MQFFVGVAKQFPPVPPEIMMMDNVGDTSSRLVLPLVISEPASLFLIPSIRIAIGAPFELNPLGLKVSVVMSGLLNERKDLGEEMKLAGVTV